MPKCIHCPFLSRRCSWLFFHDGLQKRKKEGRKEERKKELEKERMKERKKTPPSCSVSHNTVPLDRHQSQTQKLKGYVTVQTSTTRGHVSLRDVITGD